MTKPINLTQEELEYLAEVLKTNLSGFAHITEDETIENHRKILNSIILKLYS